VRGALAAETRKSTLTRKLVTGTTVFAVHRRTVTSAFYGTAIVLLVAKALLVVGGVFLGAHAWSVGIPHLVWLAGKVVPAAICLAFLIDAVLRPRTVAIRAFWTAMSVIVPLVSMLVALKEGGRL
jgi:hypothetical protein